MQKALSILLLAFAVIFSLAACDGNKPEDNPPEHIHSFGEWETKKPATCTENGEKIRYCSCGDKQIEPIYASGKHTEVVDQAKDATCTETGLTEGKHCSVCNKVLVAQTVIDALGHNYVNNTCQRCGEFEYMAGIYDANDNLISSWDELVNTYGMDVSKDYTHSNYNKTASSPYYVLTNNSKLSNGVKLIIDNSVTTIGDYAFYYRYNLTSVVISDSVTSIGGCAFAECTSLASITIPDRVTSIGGSAFSGCKSLTSITIPGSVTSIGDWAFYDCYSLTSIGVDENNQYFKSIDGNLYSKDGNTLIQYAIGKTATSLVIPSGVTSIGDYAFAYCDNLTSITIPDSVTSIGDWAFFDCDSLTSVEISDSVTSIGDRAFYLCDSLTSITIPDSVTSIGDWAFYLCDSLTSIKIPDSVTSIGDYAFYLCESLTSIEVDENNQYYKSIDGNLYSKDGKKLIQYAIGKTAISFVIPSGVTSIGDYALYLCDSLTSISIPDSVTSIGEKAFAACFSLTSIEVDENNQYYKSIDGNLYSKDGKKLIHCAMGKTATSFVIPSGVTSIGDEAFYNCYRLTSIKIPDSVTSIGDFAFRSCYSLTSITIPDSVTGIGDYAFFSCESLTDVVIPDSVTSIGDWAFSDCESLTDVYYTGSEAEWANISIKRGNDDLINARIYFNYIPE